MVSAKHSLVRLGMPTERRSLPVTPMQSHQLITRTNRAVFRQSSGNPLVAKASTVLRKWASLPRVDLSLAGAPAACIDHIKFLVETDSASQRLGFFERLGLEADVARGLAADVASFPDNLKGVIQGANETLQKAAKLGEIVEKVLTDLMALRAVKFPEKLEIDPAQLAAEIIPIIPKAKLIAANLPHDWWFMNERGTKVWYHENVKASKGGGWTFPLLDGECKVRGDITIEARTFFKPSVEILASRDPAAIQEFRDLNLPKIEAALASLPALVQGKAQELEKASDYVVATKAFAEADPFADVTPADCVSDNTKLLLASIASQCVAHTFGLLAGKASDRKSGSLGHDFAAINHASYVGSERVWTSDADNVNYGQLGAFKQLQDQPISLGSLYGAAVALGMV